MNLPPNSSRTPALRWLSLLAILLALNCIQSARAQSYALTNLWSITPVTNTILNSVDNLSRGMAYNPATGRNRLAYADSPTASAIWRAMYAETLAGGRGLLQRIDPRVNQSVNPFVLIGA